MNKTRIITTATQETEFAQRMFKAMTRADVVQSELAQQVLVNGEPIKQQSIFHLLTKAQGSNHTGQIADVLGVNERWLATGEGEMIQINHFQSQVQSNIATYDSRIINQNSDIPNILQPILGTIEMGKDGFNIEIKEIIINYGVHVPHATPHTRLFQFVGSQLARPWRDGWHIACDENAPLNEGEPVLIENNDGTWIFAEYLFGRDSSIEIDSLGQAGRMSLQRISIKCLYPMIGIYPPSQRREIQR